MDEKTQKSFYNIASLLLTENYDYYWLKSVLNSHNTIPNREGTLITGSSHALYGIWEPFWSHARNCSMHSQDIYYDFLCAKQCIPSGKFNKCILVFGYYIPFQDLSKSTVSAETVITNIYKSLFNDVHNKKIAGPTYDPYDVLTKSLGDISKKTCDSYITKNLQQINQYFNEKYRNRIPMFDFNGRSWQNIGDDERVLFAANRAASHNKFLKYEKSYHENLSIFNEYINFLYEYKVTPIVAIAPFSQEYNYFISERLKKSVFTLVETADKEVQYVDFNESDLFDCADFIDTDHLNLQGAKKFSSILSQIFGT